MRSQSSRWLQAGFLVLTLALAGCPGSSSGTPDQCPDDPDKAEPGICGCGTADTDTDGDLTADCVDGCPEDASKTAPGDCGCGVPDIDTDGDLTADCVDGCTEDASKTAPGDCGCGVPDTDTDGDLTADCVDGCTQDASKTAPGTCGCGVPDDDTDADGVLDCEDGCTQDASKTEPGICGCGVADDDLDGDGVIRCDDQCEGFDDAVDADGDGVPDGCDPDAGYCMGVADCDDGLACTAHQCVNNVCQTSPLSDCAWPAEPIGSAQNITDIEGPIWDNDLYRDLSGAVWNPVDRTLWICRNNGPSKVWAVVEDGVGGYEIDYKNGDRGEWTNFGDAEALTLADLAEPETLYVLAEGEEHVREYDLSTYGTAVLMNDWNVQPYTPVAGGSGAEGLTFVPDAFLAAQGFVDGSGVAYQSTGGMGGLMFVGHQNGGAIYVFDLDRSTGGLVYVGQYETAATETAGLEFDRSTGLLFIWHGAGFNSLEVARLSSQPSGAVRRLDTVRVHTGIGSTLLGGSNHEGIAITSNAHCANGFRSLFLTTDGGDAWSLLVFNQFPCEL